MEQSLYRAHAAMEDKHWWFLGRRTIIKTVIKSLLRDDKQQTLLDIGCGTGASVNYFLQQNFQCIGLDASPLAIKIAQQKFPNAQFRCGYMPQDILDIAATVSVFTLLDVLEHIEDDKVFLLDLINLAPKGSLILITVPALKSLWSPHDSANHHYRRYEKEELENVWKGLPVKCRMITFFNSRLYPIIKLVRLLANARNSAVGEGGSDFWIPAAPLNFLFAKIFEGEATKIAYQVDRPTAPAYKLGASLMAILQKD